MFNAIENAANFSFSLGNGVTALALANDAFVHVAESGDATPIARLIDKAKAKGDDGAARAIAFFVKQIWSDAKVTTTKGKPTSIKIKGSPQSPDALGILATAVANGVSLRSTSLKKLFAPQVATVQPEATDKDHEVDAEMEADAATEAEAPRVLGLTAVFALALELSPEDRASLVEMITESLAASARDVTPDVAAIAA